MNVIITGGSKGIGKAIASIFAQNQANIIIAARNKEELEKTSIELSNLTGLEVNFFAVDLAQKKSLMEFSDYCKNQFKSIDVLVNNAGVFIPSTFETEEGILEQSIATNLYSAYYLTQQLLPVLKVQKKAHIFNICSVASIKAYPSSFAYTISKHALYGFARTLRIYLQNTNIRISNIFPGAVYTDSWEGSGFKPERMMPVEDIALAVWNAYQMSDRTVVEDIIMRPQLGDI